MYNFLIMQQIIFLNVFITLTKKPPFKSQKDEVSENEGTTVVPLRQSQPLHLPKSSSQGQAQYPAPSGCLMSNGCNLLPHLNVKHSLNKRNCTTVTKVGGRSSIAENGFCLMYSLTFHYLSTMCKVYGLRGVGPALDMPGDRRDCTQEQGGKSYTSFKVRSFWSSKLLIAEN